MQFEKILNILQALEEEERELNKRLREVETNCRQITNQLTQLEINRVFYISQLLHTEEVKKILGKREKEKQ